MEELSLAECASLIGITNNPSIYDPYINPEKNKERQEIILAQMLDQHYITESQYNAAVKEELHLRNTSGSSKSESSTYYSYFVDQVIRDVVNDLCDKTGYAYDVVYKMVLTGGYQIYCTMNPMYRNRWTRSIRISAASPRPQAPSSFSPASSLWTIRPAMWSRWQAAWGRRKAA